MGPEKNSANILMKGQPQERIRDTFCKYRGVFLSSSPFRSCQACVEDSSCGFCYTNSSDGTCLPSAGETRSLVGRCNESKSTEMEFKWSEEYCPSHQTWVAILGMSLFVAAFGPGMSNVPIFKYAVAALPFKIGGGGGVTLREREGGGGERKRERDRETDRQTDRQTDRDREWNSIMAHCLMY